MVTSDVYRVEMNAKNLRKIVGISKWRKCNQLRRCSRIVKTANSILNSKVLRQFFLKFATQEFFPYDHRWHKKNLLKRSSNEIRKWWRTRLFDKPVRRFCRKNFEEGDFESRFEGVLMIICERLHNLFPYASRKPRKKNNSNLIYNEGEKPIWTRLVRQPFPEFL